MYKQFLKYLEESLSKIKTIRDQYEKGTPQYELASHDIALVSEMQRIYKEMYTEEQEYMSEIYDDIRSEYRDNLR